MPSFTPSAFAALLAFATVASRKASCVATPEKISLQFSEKLVPAFSKADLTMAAMPGMAAMKMPSSAAVGADGRTLTITPKQRLPRGRYSVGWQVVSSDTHKITGSYNFTVK